jgi:RHS repeat-associated protein
MLDERLYALQDANWNVTAVADTGGDVQERYAYQAYGQPLFLNSNYTSRTSSSFNWETLFAGYRWDQTTGVYLDRHRPLHVHLGSWMQRDMLGYIDGMSLYEYVRSNPLRYTDPSGEVIPVIIVGASCLACFEAMRTFLTTAHNICEDSDSVAGYSACMIDKISEMESRLDWYSWTVINAACICCGGGIAGAAKKFIKKFAQKWVKKKIAKCQAIHAAYKALNCKGCGGATTRAEVQKNIACLTAETAGRASYLKKKCDYVLPGSIGRGSKKAEKGHQTELANKTRALAKCVAKLAAMP